MYSLYDNTKELIPMSQDDIEPIVKQILLDKGLTDILYPGSNISQLSDVMTYLIHSLNTNTAYNLQETLLPLATKRTNVLWGARQLGYEPVQRVSYIYELDIIIIKNPDFGKNPGEPGYETKWNVVLPKYTKFVSGEHSYYYLDADIKIELSNKDIDDGINNSFKILIKEGELTKFEDDESLQQRAFNILDEEGSLVVKQNYLVPFDNVEERGLEVFLTYIDEQGVEHYREKWDQADRLLLDVNFDIEEKKYVKLQNIFLNMPEIYFKLGSLGPGIRLNTLIEINVLQSSGASGAVSESFVFEDVNLSEKFYINTFIENQIGMNEEKSAQIKENAPIYNNHANRLVTALDYVAMLQKHEKIKYAYCWGGEDETAQDVGIVYITGTPERSLREFKSVYKRDLDSDPTNDNDPDDSNSFFVLQNTPRHPYLQTTQGIWYLGSDDSTDNTPYPDKDNFEINDTWEIDFEDTDGDGIFTIIGGDLDGLDVKIRDIVRLEDDGSGGKVFVHKGRNFPNKDKDDQLLNWFLHLEKDILDIPHESQIDNNKILSAIKPYQIMTLKTFWRQPVYCNFDLRVQLLQHSITNAEASVDKDIFDLIEQYFYKEIERFDSRFLLSNLVKNIMDFTSLINGVNIDFTNQIVLHPTMYDYRASMFDNNQKHIFIPLSYPYERIYNIINGNLEITYLPQISCDYYPLFVDFEAAWSGDGSATPNQVNDIIACPIYKGTDNTGDVVGYYFIRNMHMMDIEIQLYFSDDGTVKTTPYGDFGDRIDLSVHPVTANIKEYDFFIDSDYGYLDLIYPGHDTDVWTNPTKGVNIPFEGYIMPRLNSVQFMKVLDI
jgi:hypothetical protein